MGKGFECEFEGVPQYLEEVTIYGGNNRLKAEGV